MALSQAPELKFNGEDIDYSGRGKAIRTHDLEQAINRGLSTRDAAATRVMIFLTGCGEGFRVAEQTVLDNTYITHANYINARKKLVEMGWITHYPGGFIAINIDNIMTYCDNTPEEEIIEEETYREITETYCNDTPEEYCDDTHNNLINNLNNNNLILPSMAVLQAQARAGLI